MSTAADQIAFVVAQSEAQDLTEDMLDGPGEGTVIAAFLAFGVTSVAGLSADELPAYVAMLKKGGAQ